MFILKIVQDFDPKVLSLRTTESKGLPLSWNTSQLSTWALKCHYSHNVHRCFYLHFIKHKYSAYYWSKVLWSFGWAYRSDQAAKSWNYKSAWRIQPKPRKNWSNNSTKFINNSQGFLLHQLWIVNYYVHQIFVK